MRQQVNHEQWDPEDGKVGTGGKTVTNRDEEWERDVRHWDSRGVPDGLLDLARPLMEGTPSQRAKAEQILARAENTFQMRDIDRKAMAKTLVDYCLLGKAKSVKAGVTKEVLAGWKKVAPTVSADDVSGSDGGEELADAWQAQYGDA